MASGDGLPLSLRPRPVPQASKAPSSIADFIARVNAQPGGFRSLDERHLREKRQEELLLHPQHQQEAPGPSGDGDLEMEDSDDDDDDASDGGRPESKDPVAVKMEVMQYLNNAANAAMSALDFLSLLLSKHNPSTAGLKLSPGLRDKVGIGSIGADRLDASNDTPERTQDSTNIALGWLVSEISQTRDAARDAAKTLQSEIAAENRYWEEIGAVQQGGWSVCKMPSQRTVLGVRFGFSEAAPEFRNQGLAPMRRAKDGSIELDCGPRGQKSERLLVSYRQNGQVVGRSARTLPTAADAPLQDRVLDARDTVFAQELWHELTREAKTLLAHDVKLQGPSQLTYAIDEETSVVFELVPLDDVDTASDPTTPYYDNLAETVCLALHLLLSYSHRQYELMRSRPLPPHIARARGQQPYTLLRPIIARLHHMKSIRACIRYVGQLTQTLRRAGLDASFVANTPQPDTPTAPTGPNQLSAPQHLMRALLQPIDFSLRVGILSSDAHDLTIRGRTFLFPVTTTNYHVSLPPSSPLHRTSCAPFRDGYPDTAAVLGYVRTAAARLLTHRYVDALSARVPATSWSVGLGGSSVVWADDADYELRFDLQDDDDDDDNKMESAPPTLSLVFTSVDPDHVHVKARWQWREGGESDDATLEARVAQVGGDTKAGAEQGAAAV